MPFLHSTTALDADTFPNILLSFTYDIIACNFITISLTPESGLSWGNCFGHMAINICIQFGVLAIYNTSPGGTGVLQIAVNIVYLLTHMPFSANRCQWKGESPTVRYQACQVFKPSQIFMQLLQDAVVRVLQLPFLVSKVWPAFSTSSYWTDLSLTAPLTYKNAKGNQFQSRAENFHE